MKRVKLFATALTLAVLALLAGRATAQQANASERTFLTFTGAVEMPGVTLQPGTYVFKLADTPSRNVVQVWDEGEKNMVGHWMFVQAERPTVTEENVVMFRETREGATPAVQFWYYPGEKIGKEFIYPKDQAERIAARTGAKVRTEGGEVSAESASAAAAVTDAPAAAQPSAAAGSLAGNRQASAAEPVEAAPEPAPVAQAAPEAAPAPEPAPAPAAVAEAPAPAPAPAAPAPTVEERIAANQPPSEPRAVGTSGQANELPRTASPLALSGLLGLLSLAGAAGLRLVRI
jgi:hypothetical protein